MANLLYNPCPSPLPFKKLQPTSEPAINQLLLFLLLLSSSSPRGRGGRAGRYVRGRAALSGRTASSDFLVSGAIPLSQSVHGADRRNRKCCQCGHVDVEGHPKTGWKFAQLDTPFDSESYICGCCYQVQRSSGKSRTPAQEQRVLRLRIARIITPSDERICSC